MKVSSLLQCKDEYFLWEHDNQLSNDWSRLFEQNSIDQDGYSVQIWRITVEAGRKGSPLRTINNFNIWRLPMRRLTLVRTHKFGYHSSYLTEEDMTRCTNQSNQTRNTKRRDKHLPIHFSIFILLYEIWFVARRDIWRVGRTFNTFYFFLVSCNIVVNCRIWNVKDTL